MKPPPDMFDGDHYWELLKAMNGTREASRQWQLFKDALVPNGFQASVAVSGMYVHHEWDVIALGM